MPLYGHNNLIWICKLDVICINSESRHVIVGVWRICIYRFGRFDRFRTRFHAGSSGTILVILNLQMNLQKLHTPCYCYLFRQKKLLPNFQKFKLNKLRSFFFWGGGVHRICLWLKTWSARIIFTRVKTLHRFCTHSHMIHVGHNRISYDKSFATGFLFMYISCTHRTWWIYNLCGSICRCIKI